MKKDKLTRRFRNAAFSTNAQMNRAVLDDLLERWDRTDSPAPAGRDIGRLLMHSRISRLMAAAVVVIVVATGLVRMGGKDNGVALGAIVDSMQKMRWVHVVATQSGKDARYESWERFDPMVIVWNQAGTIRYWDHTAGVTYVYEPQTNTITVSPDTNESNIKRPDSVSASIEMIVVDAEKAGGKVRRENAVFNGVRVQKIIVTTAHHEVTITCDIKKNVPLAIDVTTTAPETGERQAFHGVYDYPAQGPADIYEAGAPRNAKVLDNRPQTAVRELMDQVQKRFDAGFRNHIALVLDSEGWGVNELEPLRVTILRQSGRLVRMDAYRARETAGGEGNASTLYPAIKDRWPNLTIADTVALEDRRFASQQEVCDGNAFTRRTTDSSGRVNVQTIPVNLFVMDSLASLTRPNPKALMPANPSQKVKSEILPQDPNHPGWVGLRLVKTTANPGGPEIAELGRTESYWFDPARDYILMKSVARGLGQVTERTTVETAQLTDGRWYPRVIRTEIYPVDAGPRTRHSIREQRIQVDASPVFDPALFKADSLG